MTNPTRLTGAKRIFVGLGNPGEEYAHTYHNAGRLALKEITEHRHMSLIQMLKHKDIYEYLQAGDAIFVLPLLYMNESGRAVREALKKFNAQPSDLVVLHDDSDIVIGKYKVSFARNSAGHKGVQSIIDALKTNGFTRVRIGIRPAREKQRQQAGEFALKKITASYRKILNDVFLKIAQVYSP